MTQWEYGYLLFSLVRKQSYWTLMGQNTEILNDVDTDKRFRIMQSLGANGWEMVGFQFPNNSHDFDSQQFWFKRPISS